MSRWINLNARAALDAQNTAEVEVVLWHISHPDWSDVVRISTDPTERITTEPLVYGTRSAWRADPLTEPYLFATTRVEIPGDMQAAPQGRVAFEHNIPALVADLRAITSLATVHLAVVLASDPDTPLRAYSDLSLTGAEYADDEGLLIATISREPVEEERMPYMTMNRARYPGLHR